MWQRFKLILDLFRKGNEVVHKEAWKDGANVTALLAGILMGVMKLLETFGYDFQIDMQTANTIAAGLVAAVLFVVNNITSRKAGILPAKLPEPVPFPVILNTPIISPVQPAKEVPAYTESDVEEAKADRAKRNSDGFNSYIN